MHFNGESIALIISLFANVVTMMINAITKYRSIIIKTKATENNKIIILRSVIEMLLKKLDDNDPTKKEALILLSKIDKQEVDLTQEISKLDKRK